MNDLIITVIEIAETVCGICIEIPVRKMGNIQKISGRQNQLIRCNTPALLVSRVSSVIVVSQILIRKSKNTTTEIHRARTAVTAIYIAPVQSHDLLVDIDIQMQSGDLVTAISIRIVFVITQTILVQIDCR